MRQQGTNFHGFLFLPQLSAFHRSGSAQKRAVIMLPLYPITFFTSLLFDLFITNFQTVVLSNICENQEVNLAFYTQRTDIPKLTIMYLMTSRKGV